MYNLFRKKKKCCRINKSFNLGDEANGMKVMSLKFLMGTIWRGRTVWSFHITISGKNLTNFHFICLKFVMISIGDGTLFGWGYRRILWPWPWLGAQTVSMEFELPSTFSLTCQQWICIFLTYSLVRLQMISVCTYLLPWSQIVRYIRAPVKL